jgi:hypothetical protein
VCTGTVQLCWAYVQMDGVIATNHKETLIMQSTAYHTPRALLLEPDGPNRVAHIYIESKRHLSATSRLQIHGYGDRGIYRNAFLVSRCLQKHLPGVLNVLLDLDQEGHSLSAIE